MTDGMRKIVAKVLEELIAKGEVESAGKNEKGEELWRLTPKGRLRHLEGSPTESFKTPTNPGTSESVG